MKFRLGERFQFQTVTATLSSIVAFSVLFSGCTSGKPEPGVQTLGTQYEVFEGYRVGPTVKKENGKRLDMFLGVPEEDEQKSLSSTRKYTKVIYCIAENDEKSTLIDPFELLNHDVQQDKRIYIYGKSIIDKYKNIWQGLDCIASAIAIYHPSRRDYVIYDLNYTTPWEWQSIKSILKKAIIEGAEKAVQLP